MVRKQEWNVRGLKTNTPIATTRVIKPWSTSENIIKSSADAREIGSRMAAKVSKKLKLRLPA